MWGQPMCRRVWGQPPRLSFERSSNLSRATLRQREPLSRFSPHPDTITLGQTAAVEISAQIS